MQAAYTFINDVEWRLANTPTELNLIARQIYKTIGFVGTPLPFVDKIYNSRTGQFDLVLVSIGVVPFASETVYGRVRLSYDPLSPLDPIALSDSDPRLFNWDAAYAQRITGVDIDADGNIVLTNSVGTELLSTKKVILSQSDSAQTADFWITGQARASQFVVNGGLSTQFLKADGTLDSNVYLTGNQTVTLSGEASGSGATAISVTLSNAAVIGKTLTGYVAGAGTVSSSDSLLSAIQKLDGNIGSLVTGVSSVFGRTGAVTAQSGDYTTAQVSESGNLYFTDARARAAIDLTVTGSSGASTYNNTTGILNIPTYTLAGLGGQPLSTNLTSLSGLTYSSLAFVKMTAAGTFALDTNTYLTGNQTITLSGDVSGSGTTAITTTIGAGKVTNAMLAGSIAASKLIGTDIDTVGTITSGTWNASQITDAYIASAANWNTAYTNRITSLTTTGNSGAATLISNTLNIPNYTLAGLGGVPYTGATTNVDLGEYYIKAGYFAYDTTPSVIPTAQGATYWDDAEETVAIIMNGVTQRVGLDTFFNAKNSTGVTIPKGTAVRFAGTDGNSGNLLIAPMLADGTYSSVYYMGITAEAIGNGQFGKVMSLGKLRTNTNAYNDNDILYVSSTVAGGFQTTAPLAPNNIIIAAAVVNAANNGILEVRATLGSNINNDEGVKITTPLTGQLLQLQANGLWENKTKAQVLGGTSSQFVKGDGSLDSNVYLTGNQNITLSGEASGSGATSISVTLDNTAVISKVLTGLNLTGGGTIVSTDNILQAFGKVQNQISALMGGVMWQGVWDASTNTPTLTSSVGTKGYYYIVNVAGTTNLNGITDWAVGDWAIFNGTTWDKVDNTDAVSSVNGFTGAVNLTTANITEVTNLYFTQLRARQSISETITGIDYDSNTGVFSLTSGYVIPTTTSASEWDAAYASRIATFTTTGNSGAATFSGNTLNIPTYTLAGLGGQPLNTNLTSLSNLAYTSLAFVKMTSAGTFALDTNTYLTSTTGVTTVAGTSNQVLVNGGTAAVSGAVTLTLPQSINTTATPQFGKLGLGGAPTASQILRIESNITGSTTTNSVFLNGVIQSDVTGAAYMYRSSPSTLASAFTLADLSHFIVVQGTIGATSIITEQSAYRVFTNFTGAGSNYGFRGQIPSGANRWNTYMDGTAANYFAGKVQIGSTTDGGEQLQVTGTARITGAATFSSSVTANGVLTINTGTVNQNAKILGNKIGFSRVSDAAEVVYFSKNTDLGLQGTANINGYDGIQFRTQGAETVKMTITPAGNVQIGSTTPTAGAEKLQVTGSASISSTLLVGGAVTGSSTATFAKLNIGTPTGSPIRNVSFSAAITGSTTSYSNFNEGVVQSDVTTNAIYFGTIASTLAASFTLTNLIHYRTAQSTIGVGSTVTNQYGFVATSSLIGATNNYGFYSDLASAANRWNFYANGTATNYFNGNVQIGSTTPTAGAEKLQVTGTARITGATTLSSTLAVTGAATFSSSVSVGAGLKVFSDRYNNSLTFDSASALTVGGSIRQLAINTDDASPFGISIQARTNGNGAANLYFQSLGGNVGIGNTTPDSILHLKGVQTTLSITDTTYARKSEIGYLDYANLYLANDSASNTYIGRHNNLFMVYNGGNAVIGGTSIFHSSKLSVGGSVFFQYAPNTDIGGRIYGYNDTSIQTYEGGLKFQSFKYNGSSYTMEDAMTISGRGNVLIGNTVNRLRLTVSGSDANAPALGTASGTMLLANSAGSSEYGTMFGISSSGYGWIQQQRVDGTATAYNLLLQPSGGNIGIGTTTPNAKLTVEGILATKPSGVNAYYSYLRSNWSADNAFELGISDDGINTFHKLITSSDYYNGSTLQLWTSDTERMRIVSNGNVLIGTTTDNGYKLQVNGTSYINGDILIKGVYNPYTSANRGTLMLNGTTDNVIAFSDNVNAKGYIFHDGTNLELLNATAAGSLKFYTNNTTALTIASSGAATFSGNVTIGDTLTFKASLDGIDSFDIRPIASTANFLLTNYRGAGTSSIQFNSNGNTLINQSGGNVGIGTTSPAGILHVNGQGARFVDSVNTFGLIVGAASASPNWVAMGTSGTGVPQIQGYNNAFSATTNLALQPNGGNVGIGTTTPTYKLVVSKTSISAPALMIGGAYFGGPRIQTYGLDSDPNAWMGLGTDMGVGSYEHSIYYPAYSGVGKLTFGTYNGTTYSTKMLINESGNLLIGTTTDSGFKLLVNGDARVNNRVYIGTNGCYIEEVLVGSNYELRVSDSAGNTTIIS
jgi:hypothetical protein